MSQGFASQNAAVATPSMASTRSVERLWNEKSPESRKEVPRASLSIGAIRPWLTATIASAAAAPPAAYEARWPWANRLVTPWKLAHAASIESVQLEMLNTPMYHAMRVLSHSGTW